jgi:hypothetical protein
MLKISRNRLGEYNKSCSTTHQESRKIGFAFFWFSYDFLENLQDSAIWMYYWRCIFTQGPLEFFRVSQNYPSFALRPSGGLKSSHSCPPAAGWARRRRTAVGGGKHTAWGCDWAHHTSIDGSVPTGDDPGKRWWRGRGGAPATARVPARLGAGKLNAQPWELKGDLRKG